MTEQLLASNQIPLLEELAEYADSLTIRRRARLLLLYNAGQNTREISESISLSPRSVRYWRREYLNRGMEIFSGIAKFAEAAFKQPPPEEITPLELAPAPEVEKPTQKTSLDRAGFPKMRKKPGIKPDDPMAEAGRKILNFHFARMLNHEEGTRLGEDIEELHDMRVATRRMRAAFEVFGEFFKPKAVKQHLKGLRATGRALGRVRDLDVFMEKASHYLETLHEEGHTGLEPLVNAWQMERTTEREKMLTYLEGEGYQNFIEEFNIFVSTTGNGARPVSTSSPTPHLLHHVAPMLIYTRLAAVRAYETIMENAAIEQLHALRIEFKKLRYAVEFFHEVLGEQAKQVIDDIKKIQDHLGDLNDADVATHTLREFIETWEERQINLPLHQRQNPEPVVAYLASKHAERHRLMVTFPKVWAYFNRSEFLENLAQAISVL
jgi:CHAD domain-containing protein